jgi:hypothetical protein
MLNIDEILFANKQPKESSKKLNALFNTSIDWDTDMVSVDVSYFLLKEDKTLGDDNIISAGELLIGIGVCDKTGMINVCHFDEDYHKYFWINSEDVKAVEPVVEHWEFNDVKRHIKAIKERWTTQIVKDIKKDSNQKKNRQKSTEQKGMIKRKAPN